ncbi:MAG TPA: GntR family transcriptional regulator [bacterium]|nr:GntR family transcriptional regulator [bacterium]
MGQIKRGIATGALAAGAKLPSVRDLAKLLVINPNTIVKIYTELEREGLLLTRRGLGTFVAGASTRLSRAERERLVSQRLDGAIVEAVNLGLTAADLHRLLAARCARFDCEREKNVG